MTAIIMDGKALAKEVTDEIKSSVEKMDKKPCIAVVLVGEDPASKIYIENKIKKTKELGITSVPYILPKETPENIVLDLIESLNSNDDINSILVQLPLPNHISENKVIQTISPEKDVDGFTYSNVAKLVLNENNGIVPCTPQGIVLLLKKYIKNVSGLNVCIIGRSNIVGRPLSVLLLQEDCSVTICHSKTKNLKEHCLSSDIVIACVGQKNLITADMIKEGAVVIDIGINRIEGTKKICGDVNFAEVSKKASFITPVPGGVGPMTIACLMKNTLLTAKK